MGRLFRVYIGFRRFILGSFRVYTGSRVWGVLFGVLSGFRVLRVFKVSGG